MSQTQDAERLECIKKTKISLRNFKKLKTVLENLEQKELQLKKNKQKIKTWKVFKSDQKELLQRRDSVIAEVSFLYFLFIMYKYYC